MLEKSNEMLRHVYFLGEKPPQSTFSNDFVPHPQGWCHSTILSAAPKLGK